MDAAFDREEAEAAIRRWLERAVIGLNLCPFAKSAYVRNQVRIVISDADNTDDLRADVPWSAPYARMSRSAP